MRDLIRGLGRPALRLLRRDERGVVAVLVGMLIGTVLLGLGALVIDVGQLYTERAQLQNGADAGALAAAKSCILGSCTTTSAKTIAGTYANENASALTGGKEAVASVCGYAAGDSLTACGASSGAMTACPSPPASGTNYVDVNTSTKTSGGATVIAPVFAQELLGNGSYTGTKVLACAQVQWGIGSGSITCSNVPTGLCVAFTTTACQWDKQTSAGHIYGSPPSVSLPPSSYDMELTWGYGNGTGCSTESAGSDGPGTFGWLTETGGCTLQLPITTYSVKSSSYSPNCNTPLFDDAQNKSLIYIPVYTSVTSLGTVYNVTGVAAFVVTGYNIPGSTFTSYSDWLNSANTCTGTNYCIDGYFVSEPGTLSSSGVTSMQITG